MTPPLGAVGRWASGALVTLLLLGGASLLGVTGAGSPAHAPVSVGRGGPESGDVGPLLPMAVPLTPLGPPHPNVGGQGRLIVNTTDPMIVPNTGIRTNITDYFANQLNPDSAFQVAAEEAIGAYVAVFGIFQNDHTFPVAFFSIFNNTTDSTVHLGYWSQLLLVGATSYDFALTLEAGTNWTLTVNGGPFGGNGTMATFDFGTRVADWAPSVSFSEVALYSSTLTTPAYLDVPLAFAVLRPAGWYLPDVARSYMVTSEAGWGADGRLQNGSLAPGELETGTAYAPRANGTSLWTGGPVPVGLGLGLSETSVRGTTTVVATVSAYAIGGAAIPGVSIAFSDELNGSFEPSSVVTGATGFATALVGVPNVTANSSDLVVATVTVFGYIGRVGVLLSIQPPIELHLAATPSAPVVLGGGSVTFTLRVADGSGVPVGGVLLLASILGGTALVTPYVTTDGSGQAALVFSAPPSPGPVNVSVLVVEPGFWGRTIVTVLVRAPPPTFWSVAGSYVLLAVAAALLAVVVLAMRWKARHRPRLPIPNLALPDGPPPVPSAPRKDALSRRPP